ncbi:MAG: hypothetical protein U0133_02035 [Gemmatimonadales bacterium]
MAAAVAVYLATDLRHGRKVALKLLHDHVGAVLGPSGFSARCGSRPSSPIGILTVLDSGQIDGEGQGRTRWWYTMPFVAGESLRDRLLPGTAAPPRRTAAAGPRG